MLPAGLRAATEWQIAASMSGLHRADDEPDAALATHPLADLHMRALAAQRQMPDLELSFSSSPTVVVGLNGGTGKFRGAHGHVKSTDIGNTNNSDITITFTG